MNNPNPYNFSGEFAIPCHLSHGAPSLEIGPSKDSGTKEDQLLNEVLGEVGPMGLEDEEGQLTLEQGDQLTFFMFVHV